MATSFMMMFSYLVACISPWLLGALKPAIGLSGGMILMGLVCAVSAIPLIMAQRYTFHKDRLQQ